MTFSIFRRAGRAGWCLKYRARRGAPPRFRQFATRAEAEDFALDLRRNPDSGSNQTLKTFAERWLKDQAGEVRASTLSGYRSIMETHVLPALGHIALRDLRRSHVKAFLTAKKAETTQAGKPRGRAHVAQMRTVLHGCLEEARDEDLIGQNPAAVRRRRAGSRAARPQVKAFDAEQLARFLATAATVRPERYPLFRLLAGTGLRLGEAFGLQWDDLDLAGAQLVVQRTVSQGQAGPVKTHRSNRPVDMSPGLVGVLKTYDAATKAAALQNGRQRSPWVFPGARGGAAYHSPVEDDFKAVLRAAALPAHFTPHALRHTYASLLLADGESPVYVQEQLGHASIALTVDRYGRWLRKKSTGARDRLDALMSPKMSPASGRHGAQ